MNELDLLIDLHGRNDRQGPGSDEETRRAIELARLDRGGTLRIADIGCGTGASTLVLADTLGAHVTAVDFAEPFLERLRDRAVEAGLSDRIETVCASMDELPFSDEQFDVIWAEGSIYNIGFAEGLRAWRRFLRPGGVIAVTEISWTTSDRPEAVDAHWQREYPGIARISEKVGVIESEGYRSLGAFLLPRSCWTEHYYDPIRAGLDAFVGRHAGSDAAREIARGEEMEIDMFETYGDWYGYVFYVAERMLEHA